MSQIPYSATPDARATPTTPRALPTAVLAMVATLTACSSIEATALEVRGEVTFRGEPLLGGMTIDRAGEIVVNHGRAMLAVKGLGELRLYDNTRLQLGSNKSSVKLTLGRLWATITALSDGEVFEVTTVNAVAGVRGTTFVTRAQDDETTVGVVDGEVEVSSRGGGHPSRRLRQGSGTHISGDGPPEEPHPYDPTGDRSLWRRLARIPKQIGREVRKGGRLLRDATKEPRRQIRDEAKKAVKDLKKLFR